MQFIQRVLKHSDLGLQFEMSDVWTGKEVQRRLPVSIPKYEAEFLLCIEHYMYLHGTVKKKTMKTAQTSICLKSSALKDESSPLISFISRLVALLFRTACALAMYLSIGFPEESMVTAGAETQIFAVRKRHCVRKKQKQKIVTKRHNAAKTANGK